MSLFQMSVSCFFSNKVLEADLQGRKLKSSWNFTSLMIKFLSSGIFWLSHTLFLLCWGKNSKFYISLACLALNSIPSPDLFPYLKKKGASMKTLLKLIANRPCLLLMHWYIHIQHNCSLKWLFSQHLLSHSLPLYPFSAHNFWTFKQLH